MPTEVLTVFRHVKGKFGRKKVNRILKHTKSSNFAFAAFDFKIYKLKKFSEKNSISKTKYPKRSAPKLAKGVKMTENAWPATKIITICSCV